jgi:large repetitive protein
VLGEPLEAEVSYSSGTVPQDAGTYTATLAFAGSRNYEPATASATITISKAVPTIVVTGGGFAYDLEPHAASASASGVLGEDLGPLVITYEPGGSVPVNAGEYLATAHYAGSQNYEAATSSATLTITPGAANVQVVGGSFIYDGQPHPATGSVTGIDGAVLGPLTFTYNGSQTPPVHAGQYSVVATFAGAANYSASTATAAIVIKAAPVAISADDATKIYGQPNPPFTATYIGLVPGDGPDVFDGVLSFETTATNTAPVGSYAVYPGGVSAYDYVVKFVAGQLSVTPAAAGVTLTSSSNPAGYQQTIALRAEVVPLPIGSGVATGTVDFTLGDGTILGSSTVISGVASLNTVLPPGTHEITARYSGDTNVTGGTALLSQSVNARQGSSETVLSVRPSTSSVGELVSLEARVSGSGTATGTVEFLDGDVVIGAASLVNGRAPYETSSLGVGAHVLTARYLGNDTLPGSLSSPVVHNVTDGSQSLARTMVQISAKGIRVGEDAVIDVRVSSPTGTPAGAVTISVDGQVRATLTLDAAGSAQLRVSGLSEGRHPVVVVLRRY